MTVLTMTFNSAIAADIKQYRIGTGDTIHIKVSNEEDLELESRVDESGEINYHYLGSIQITGYSTQQLESIITERLRDGYLRNPSVRVSIVEYRPFFINGQVKSPDSYPYQPGLNLDKAISIAGGLTDRASKRKMFLIRETPTGSTARQRIRLADDVLPGDIITIEEGFF